MAAIYLYHPLFVAAIILGAGARLAMPTSLLFVLGGIAGVVGPMMMERVARQIPGGQLLLEGRMASAARPAEARVAGPQAALITDLRRTAPDREPV